MMTKKPPKPDAATIRQIAVEAYADPRTVARHLSGKPVRGLSAMRIDAALQRLGMVRQGKPWPKNS